MREFHNKLVRDRIPEIIAAEENTCEAVEMDENEYRQALLAKLVEEAQEVAVSKAEDRVKEIAELHEVLDTIIAAFDLNRDNILATQRIRRDERGGFENRIKLL
jgi:predicted house-cleaning noncanonical NTP pyrophosphatase (MazG superfamily)